MTKIYQHSVTPIKSMEQRITALHCDLNDLYWLFSNGSIKEAEYIVTKDKINNKIIELRKENKNE